MARFESIKAVRRPGLQLRLPERWFEAFQRVTKTVVYEPGVVVEWMMRCSTDMDLLLSMADAYRGQGVLQVVSGDPWSPGMVIGDYRSVQQTGPSLFVDKVKERVAEVPLFRKRWDKYKQLIVMYLEKYNKQNRAIFNFFQNFSRLPHPDQIPIPSFPAGDGTPLSPSLPFSYQLIRPALRTAFSFSVQIPEESKLKVLLWDSGKSTIAESSEVVLPEGGHDVVATFGTTPLSGYMEVDPTEARSGITIANLNSSPMSV